MQGDWPDENQKTASTESGLNHPKRDFPGGPVVKNPPANTGDTGLIPGQGAKIPHASRPKTQTKNKYKRE